MYTSPFVTPGNLPVALRFRSEVRGVSGLAGGEELSSAAAADWDAAAVAAVAGLSGVGSGGLSVELWNPWNPSAGAAGGACVAATGMAAGIVNIGNCDRLVFRE